MPDRVGEPPQEVVLLDEELALLVPGMWPLPWLARIPDAEHDAVLRTAARGLVARGVAVATEGALAPLPAVARLLAPLSGEGPCVQMVTAVEGQQRVLLTVLRPLGGSAVHLHDTSEDGIHRLSVLPREAALDQLEAAVAPLGTDPDADPCAEPGPPRAAARLSLRAPGRPPRQVSIVTGSTACRWNEDDMSHVVGHERLRSWLSGLLEPAAGSPTPAGR